MCGPADANDVICGDEDQGLYFNRIMASSRLERVGTIFSR